MIIYVKCKKLLLLLLTSVKEFDILYLTLSKGSMEMKAVRRNAVKKIENIFNNAVECKSYSLHNNFSGLEVPAEWIKGEYEKFDFTKMRTDGEGNYTVQVHSNQWYEFKSVS